MKKGLTPSQKYLVVISAFVFFNLLFTVLGLWRKIYLLGVVIDFALIVLIAQQLANVLRVKDQKIFEKVLAVGFPLLVLLAWELTVQAGILNARWFPPPSRIAVALWELITGYDNFTKTSLLGRPWLIPQKFSENGWKGVSTPYLKKVIF